MGSVNKVILVGHLGRDAELRYTQGGAAVATLNMATTETWNDKDSGEKKERTEWHRVVLWGKTEPAGVPHEGEADLRRGFPPDAEVAGQGRQRPVHDGDQGAACHAARRWREVARRGPAAVGGRRGGRWQPGGAGRT